jgi:hypothetical protein
MSDADHISGDVNPSHSMDVEPIWSGMGPDAEMQAVGIQTVLASAGIDAIINGFSAIPSVPFEVLVARSRALEAKRTLAEALEAGPQAAEEGEAASELPGSTSISPADPLSRP